MRFARTAIILFALTWTAGPLASAEQRARRTRANRCYAVRVEAISSRSTQTTNRRRYRHGFSAHEVLDLRLSVWLPAGSEASVAEIQLYTPTGRLYEVLRATADASTASETNYRGRRVRVMSARLPVAGSHITSRSLYGKWRAEVFLDESEKSCTTRPKHFTIVP